MGPAMSRALAMRPIGMDAAARSRPPASITAATISVSTQPGATLFTVIPRGASSIASDFTNEIVAPFAAA